MLGKRKHLSSIIPFFVVLFLMILNHILQHCMKTSDRSHGAKPSVNLFIINACMAGAQNQYNAICLAKY